MKIIQKVRLSESNKPFQCTKGYYLNTNVALCNSFQTKQNDRYEYITPLLKFLFRQFLCMPHNRRNQNRVSLTTSTVGVQPH